MRGWIGLTMIAAALLGASLLSAPRASADLESSTPTGEAVKSTTTATSTAAATPTAKPELSTIRGTVVGFDSMRDPPVVLLLTPNNGAVLVELLDRDLLEQVDTGKTLLLYGKKTGEFDFSALGSGEAPAQAATASGTPGPGVAEPPKPPAADLSGMVDGVNSFTDPAVALVRSDDGTVWTVSFQNDELLTKVRMGRMVYLLGKKTGPDTFQASGVLVH